MAIKQLDHVNFITHDMEATINFYTQIIGMVVGEKIDYAPDGIVYLYIAKQQRSVLHIGDAAVVRQSARFHEYAKYPNTKEAYATGAIDHFCLTYDFADYELILQKIQANNIRHEVYISPNNKLKQIWAFDPNGVRVECNFYID